MQFEGSVFPFGTLWNKIALIFTYIKENPREFIYNIKSVKLWLNMTAKVLPGKFGFSSAFRVAICWRALHFFVGFWFVFWSYVRETVVLIPGEKYPVISILNSIHFLSVFDIFSLFFRLLIIVTAQKLQTII